MMMKEIAYPDAGQLAGRNGGKDRTLCGGRNGISYCTAVRYADYGPYIVLRPITATDEKANTFIDVPADAETLSAIARCFEASARARAPEQDSHEERLKRRYRCAAEDLSIEAPLQVDDDAPVSIEGQHGAHVQIWVWVPSDDLKGETTGIYKPVNALDGES